MLAAVLGSICKLSNSIVEKNCTNCTTYLYDIFAVYLVMWL